MNKNRRSQPLRVESLESMMLLSGLPAVGMIQAAEVSAAAASLSLRGVTNGTFVATQSNPDTGKDYHVTTHGWTPFGAPINVTGDLITPGFIAQGRTTGTLTFANARGTLTLAVTGPTQPAFSGLPSQVGYTITGGTGIYARHHSGHGTIAISSHLNAVPSGVPVAVHSQTGTIRLVFKA